METMSGFMLLTFWLCAGVNYIMLRNMSKRQKGLLLGVTLPPEADALPEVQAIVKQYRTRLGTLCLVCAALSVPLAFVQETAIALTLWMLFFFAGLALPYLPLLRANAKLKALKKAAAGQNAPTRVVDTAASAFALPKPMGLWTLLPPLVLSLAPIALPGLPRGVALACGIDAATLLLLWVLGRTTFRRREDMVTADSARNQTLLRVRRLYWDRFWRLNLWALAVLNGMLALGFRSEATILGGTLGFTVLLVAATLWMELSVRRAQAVLTDAATIVADEDDAWLGGIFYYNPTDKRFLVAKRIGLGSTVNLGTWAGKLYYAFVGLVLVACLAIGPIFGLVDSIPTRLELSGSAPVCLVASHGQSEKYRLDTDAITDVQLRDTLPDAARTWGTGMDHYLQGDFYVVGEGNARFCLDPTQKCFLRVEAGGCIGSPEIPRTTPPPLRRHCNPPFTPDAKGRGSRILAPAALSFCHLPQNATNLQKMLQFFLQKRRFTIDSLVIIEE